MWHTGQSSSLSSDVCSPSKTLSWIAVQLPSPDILSPSTPSLDALPTATPPPFDNMSVDSLSCMDDIFFRIFSCSFCVLLVLHSILFFSFSSLSFSFNSLFFSRSSLLFHFRLFSSFSLLDIVFSVLLSVLIAEPLASHLGILHVY